MGSALTRFLGTLAVFAVPFVVLLELSCRLLFAGSLQTEVNARKSITLFESISSNVDVLFVGNSYSYYGINPAYIALPEGLTSHNFSFAGEGIGDTFYKLSYYLRRQKLGELKLVVINVTNFYFFGPANAFNSAFPYGRYYDLTDIARSNPAFLRSAVFSSFSMYRLSVQAKSLIGNLLFGSQAGESLQLNGYSRREHAFSEAALNAEIETYLQWEAQKDYTPDPVLLDYYNKLLRELKQRNIDVIFVIVPMPVMFLPRVTVPDVQKRIRIVGRDIIEVRTEGAIKKLYPEIPVYNHLRESGDYSLDMFSDRGHLNYRGAAVFSENLGRDIRSRLALAASRNSTP